MRAKYIFKVNAVPLLLALATAAFAIIGCRPAPPSPELIVDLELPPRPAGRYPRLVSLAPSLTETLFALGLEERIVGVTDFCRYPPAARDKPRVGGHVDLNMERLLARAPDLVIMLKSQGQDTARRLREMGIPYLIVDNRSVADIVHSIRTIGHACGVAEAAERLAGEIEDSRRRVREFVRLRTPQDILLCLGSGLDGSSGGEFFIAGQDSIFDQLLSLAGGRNAYRGGLDYATLSQENIIRLNPEVIVELVDPRDDPRNTAEQVVERWHGMSPHLEAVRAGRVHAIVGDHVMVPGPRIHLLLEQIAAALYPEEFQTVCSAPQVSGQN